MFTQRILLLFVACCTFSSAYTQNNWCGAVQAKQDIINQSPELKIPIQQMEAYLNALDVTHLEKTRAGNYIIPIVFHIIHNYGPENISDDQVRDAVRILNEEYQKRNADTIDVIPIFKPLIANVGFEFRLANKDPEGNCTNGIDRIHSYKTYLGGNQSKFNSWNRSHYFNVWVVNTLAGDAGLLAFALPPAAAHYAFYWDGVIAEYNAVGSVGAAYVPWASTLTHEIGHCMNLSHLWGNTNDPQVACGDDGVQDTPETKGHSTCTNADLADDFCNPGTIENVQNYMEYSFCDHMFTLGQKDRMIAAITSPTAQRNSLYTAQSHAFAGVDGPRQDCAPRADFNVNKQFACIGNPFSFSNKSFNDTTMTAASWDFSASGIPATSTSLNNVSVSFATTGWKNISLNVSSNGGSGGAVKSNYVYVADPVGKVVTGQINHFEDENVFNNTWANFNYYNNQFKWQHYNLGGYQGGACIRYRGFDDRAFPQSTVGSAQSDVDELITEAYDLSALTLNNAYLNFYLAGATRASVNADIDDSLIIQYSTNCGANWSNLVKLSKTSLINNGTINTEFNTNNAVWMAKTFPLPQAALTNSTFFKLRYRPGDNSNNVYLDNFEINSTPVSVKNISTVGYEFDLVPNPATSFSSIHINSSENAEAMIIVTNLLGDQICSFTHKVLSGSIHKIELPERVFANKGICFINIQINGKKAVRKLVIQ